MPTVSPPNEKFSYLFWISPSTSSLSSGSLSYFVILQTRTWKLYLLWGYWILARCQKIFQIDWSSDLMKLPKSLNILRYEFNFWNFQIHLKALLGVFLSWKKTNQRFYNKWKRYFPHNKTQHKWSLFIELWEENVIFDPDFQIVGNFLHRKNKLWGKIQIRMSW